MVFIQGGTSITRDQFFKYGLVCVLVVFTGLGLALVLPRIASTQGQAAQSETSREINAPVAESLYVSKNGNGSTGLTWTDAYTNVQDALAGAAAPAEIWVAEGIYYPDEGASQTNNDSFATFVMTNGVALYGGFRHGDSDITDRDWADNLTILSGDIDKNDISPDGVVRSTDHIIGVNTRHVITAKGVDRSVVIDGFIITAGKAFKFVDISGGGFLCDGSGKGNQCSPTLKNITFSGNYAEECGGGMYNNGSQGGRSNPILINTIFSGNFGPNGGAACNGYELPTNISNSKPEMINVLFIGNKASNGGAMYNYGYEGTSIVNMYNSILWNNKAISGTSTIDSNIYNNGAVIFLAHSLVEGAFAGGKWVGGSYLNGGDNIDEDPMFVAPINPGDAPTNAGNLRLQDGSPAIDAGDNNFISGTLTDLDGGKRIVDGDLDGTLTVDMGGFEFQLEYSFNGYIPLVFR